MRKKTVRAIFFTLLACSIVSLSIGFSPSVVHAEGEVPEIPVPSATTYVETAEELTDNSEGSTGSENPIITPAQMTEPSPSQTSVENILGLDPWYFCVNDTIDGIVDGICHYSSIQAAIDDFITRNGHGIITLETGTFTENVTITNIPNLTGLSGMDPFILTIIEGNLQIQTVSGFLLQNLNVQGGISFTNSTGPVTISTVQATNPVGNAIELTNHVGDIIINSTNVYGSSGYGLRIRGNSGSVTIQSSTMNENYTGASIFTNGYIFIDSSTMSSNATSGLEILNADSVFISNSSFLNNQGMAVAGIGVLARGPIVINGITSNNNKGDGILLFSMTGDIFLSNSEFNKNGMYGVRVFWPSENMLTVSHVTTCDNIVGSAFFMGGSRVGTIYDCAETDAQISDLFNHDGSSYQRVIILNQTTLKTEFKQDYLTLVLIQDDSVSPAMTIASISFPNSNMSVSNNIQLSIVETGSLSNPPPDTLVRNSQAFMITATDGNGNPVTEINPAFTICFTNSASNSTTQAAFLPVNGTAWQIVEPQTLGNQSCFQQNSTGTFVFGTRTK